MLAETGPAAESAPGSAPGPLPALPAQRTWGFTVQLYSLRSMGSWGHGDLHDLAELAAWSARELGAGFIQVNPLHAAEPLPPISPSPYLPMTRMFTSPLYLRVEDIPEYHQLADVDRAAVRQLAAPLRARNCTPELIDRDAVWLAKRAALELISQIELTPERRGRVRGLPRRARGGAGVLVGLVRPGRTARARLADVAAGLLERLSGSGDRGGRCRAAPRRVVPFLAAVALRSAAGRRAAGGDGRRDGARHHP